MIVWAHEFNMPKDDNDGLCGIKFEDGGQAAIMYAPVSDNQIQLGGDGHFYIQLHSWHDGAAKNDPSSHPLFRKFMGKRLKVTIEIVDNDINN